MKKILKISGLVVGGIILLTVVISLIPGGDKKLEQVNDDLKQTSDQLEEKVEDQLTTQVTSTPQTDQPKDNKEWVVVQDFSGVGDVDKTTENFDISGSEWRVNWSYKKDITGSTSVFGGNIWTPDRKRAGSWTATEPGSDTTVVKSGPGTYYLKIAGGNISSWSVRIEEYK